MHVCIDLPIDLPYPAVIEDCRAASKTSFMNSVHSTPSFHKWAVVNVSHDTNLRYCKCAAQAITGQLGLLVGGFSGPLVVDLMNLIASSV